ncbi:alpha/beta fold hydrolase [Dactylosporangium sp. NPDC000521]|uniref:alpha/beta fold hydrolase n=1 Tax=Dactylosporangium sp. NPDC000521 TaxID=3363975 RepID=UPI0036A2C0FA
MNRDELRWCLAAPRPAAGFRSRMVDVLGLRLHVRSRTGHDPAEPRWLLLHGLAVSHRYLMPTATAFEHGDVLVPDLPGFGLSQRPPTTFGPGRHADVVAALLDVSGVSGACVLGNSFGCQVAAELAVRRPDLVALLVLVGPTVDPAAPTAAGQARRWLRDLLREDPRQARILAADLRDAGPQRVAATLRHSVRHHIEDVLPHVAAPVLFLRGEHDPIAPPRWLTTATAITPDAIAAPVPWAAHNAVTTAGPAVAAYATAFAEQVRLRATR